MVRWRFEGTLRSIFIFDRLYVFQIPELYTMDSDSDHDQDNLLDLLQAHGQQFLSSFSIPVASGSGKKRKRTAKSPIPNKVQKLDSEEEEEWTGIKEEDLNSNDSQSENEEGVFFTESDLDGCINSTSKSLSKRTMGSLLKRPALPTSWFSRTLVSSQNRLPIQKRK